jgi:hypothetical protein
MSHIQGALKWNKAVFCGYFENATGLHINIDKNRHLTMYYENWEESYPITLAKVQQIPVGAHIKYATWNGYDELKWFCDVELV